VALQRAPEAELVADDVRAASQAVDMLVGRIGVEDLLDEIFSRFCIGK
jgi:tRNA modification GTPase